MDETTTTDSRPGGLDGFFARLHETGVRRPHRGRWVAGVCAGLAERLDIDPVVLRVAFVVAGLVLGLGVSAYLVAWLLLPGPDGTLRIEAALRRGDPSSIVLLVLAAVGLLPIAGSDGGWGGSLVGVLVVGAVTWYVVQRSRRAPAPTTPDVAGAPFPGTGPVSPATGPAASPPPQDLPAFDPVTGRWQAADAPAAAGPAGEAPPAPSAAPAAPSHAAPARRRRRRRPSIGWLGAGLLLGAVVVTVAAVLVLATTLGLPGHPSALATAAGLAVSGVGLVVAGALGRRVVLPGVVAAILAVSALANVGVSDEAVGARSWTPATIDALQSDYAVGTGDGVLDLSRLPADRLDGRQLQLNVGVGDLRVILPPGVRAEVTPDVGLGDVRWPDAASGEQRLSRPADSGNPLLVDGGGTRADSPTMHVEAHVGVGDLVFTRK